MVGLVGEFWQMLAQLVFFGGRWNRIKRSADRRGRVGLHVPSVNVRGSAAEPNEDRRLGRTVSLSLYKFR